MSVPQLFFGARDAAVMYRAEEDADDNGAAFPVRLRPRPIAPAGVGGECVFTRLFVTLTHTAGGNVRVIPIVDGREVPGSGLVIELSELEQPETRVEEIVLFEPLLVGGMEYSRQHLRGTFFTVEIATEGPLTDGLLSFDGLEIEYAVVRRGPKLEEVAS